MRRLLAFFALLLLSAAAANANMVLDNVILHFEPGQPARQDVEVSNAGEDPLYIEVRPHLVTAPGTDDEQRIHIADPREAGLLVTPNRLVIAPGGRKLLRFVDLKSGHPEERVYRVAVTPVAGELEAQTSGLKILVGYEVLVLAQPAVPEPKLVGDRDGKTINLRNEGNTNIMLREGRQCAGKDTPADACEYLSARRLYPGNSLTVALPLDAPVEYYIGVGNRSSVERWP